MAKSKVFKTILGVTAAVIGTTFLGLKAVSKAKRSDSIYDNEPEQKNPMEGKTVIFVENDEEPKNADGVKGHLEATGEAIYMPTVYDKYIKRSLDIIMSFGGLVVLSPVYAVIALAIIIDDPGPVLFTQKRVGQNKQYFKLHKFR